MRAAHTRSHTLNTMHTQHTYSTQIHIQHAHTHKHAHPSSVGSALGFWGVCVSVCPLDSSQRRGGQGHLCPGANRLYYVLTSSFLQRSVARTSRGKSSRKLMNGEGWAWAQHREMGWVLLPGKSWGSGISVLRPTQGGPLGLRKLGARAGRNGAGYVGVGDKKWQRASRCRGPQPHI